MNQVPEALLALEQQKILSLKDILEKEFLLYPRTSGRLGNWLFCWASAFAISKESKMQIVTSKSWELYQIFGEQLGGIAINNELINSPDWKFVKEENFIYDPLLISKISEAMNISRKIGVVYYLQSWRYFHPKYRKQILEMFRFPKGIEMAAMYTISKIKSKFTNKIFVAVHVRRTDLASYLGADGPGPEYLQKAAGYFIKKYQNVY